MVILLNILGIAVVIGVCWLLSSNRKAVKWKLVGRVFPWVFLWIIC